MLLHRSRPVVIHTTVECYAELIEWRVQVLRAF